MMWWIRCDVNKIVPLCAHLLAICSPLAADVNLAPKLQDVIYNFRVLFRVLGSQSGSSSGRAGCSLALFGLVTPIDLSDDIEVGRQLKKHIDRYAVKSIGYRQQDLQKPFTFCFLTQSIGEELRPENFLDTFRISYHITLGYQLANLAVFLQCCGSEDEASCQGRKYVPLYNKDLRREEGKAYKKRKVTKEITIRDKGLRALNQNSARTICIVFVNRDIYRWNQRSLLSQKQVRKLVVMPRALFGNSARKAIFHLGKVSGVELPGLHGGVFSFFVRTNIAEKRRAPGLFSQFPRVEVRKLVVMPRALFGNSARKAIFHLGKVSGVELPGLHGGVFSFFVRTNIAEKRRAPGLFSQFPRVERISESQKQVRKVVVMPRALFGNSARKAIFHLGKVSGVELPGLHGGVFSFFVRTFIAEKRRAPGLFSQFPRVEVRKTYVEMVTKPPSNHYHQR
ncbi:hypothetical protein PROFUN_06877 [Planoprotostelium fungivorum]|uniref:Uncharacterized protein n=1 Tax=Planoprotostelium fungivorum TaxID=1890364 RepID=A0A2P6NMT5_9EUKA|nr:hypothetical protein PROFUN_06877 [Planoprotostelium fungivorum]